MTVVDERRLITQIKTVLSAIESGGNDNLGQRELLVRLIDLFVVTAPTTASNRVRSFYHLRTELGQVRLDSKVFVDIAKEVVAVLDGLVTEEIEGLESVLPANLEELVAEYEQAVAEANEAGKKDKKAKELLARQKLDLVQVAIDRKKQIWRQRQLSQQLAREAEELARSLAQTEREIDKRVETLAAELPQVQPGAVEVNKQELGRELAEVVKSADYRQLEADGKRRELPAEINLEQYLQHVWQTEPSKFSELKKLAGEGRQYLTGLSSQIEADRQLKERLDVLETTRELTAEVPRLREGLTKIESGTEASETDDNPLLVEGYKLATAGAQKVDQVAAAHMYGGLYELAAAVMGPGAPASEVKLLAEEMFEASLETAGRLAKSDETGRPAELPGGEEYKARFADEFEQVWGETLKRGRIKQNVGVTDALQRFSETAEGVSIGRQLIARMPEKVWWPARLLSVLSGGRLSPTLARMEQMRGVKKMAVGGHQHSLAGYFVMGLVSNMVDEIFVDDDGRPTGAGHGLVAMIEYGPGIVKYAGKPVFKLGRSVGERIIPGAVREELKTRLKQAWTDRVVVPALEAVEKRTGSKILTNIYASGLAPTVVHQQLKDWRLYRWLVEYNQGTNQLYFRPLQMGKRGLRRGMIWVRTGWSRLKRTALGRAAGAVISKAAVAKAVTKAVVAKITGAVVAAASVVGSAISTVLLLDTIRELWKHRKVLWELFKKGLKSLALLGIAALGTGMVLLGTGFSLLGGAVGGLLGVLGGSLLAPLLGPLAPLAPLLGGAGGFLLGGKLAGFFGLGGGALGSLGGMLSSAASAVAGAVSGITAALSATTVTSTAMIAGAVGGTVLGVASLSAINQITIQNAFLLPRPPDLEQQSEFLQISKHVEIAGHVDPATALPNTVITDFPGDLYANYTIRVGVIDPQGKLADGVLAGVVVTMDRVSVYQGGKVTNVSENINQELGDMAVGETREVRFQLLMREAYQDSMITNEAVVTALAGTQRASANRSFVVGQPPELPPSTWPINRGCITQGPGGAESHQGVQAVDIASPRGTPVYATHDGVVEATGFIGNGYGNYVKIRGVYNGKPYYTIYAHLMTINVSPGDRVNGPWLFNWGRTRIGTVDSTGRSTGDHLHYEFRGLPMDTPFIPNRVPACVGDNCPTICT